MFKPMVAAAAAFTLFGMPIPAWGQSAKVQPVSTQPPYDAVVLPTPQQVQIELTSVGQRLKDAEMASFYSPIAENDYLEAERMYQFGNYDQAGDEAQAAAATLPEIPNWKSARLPTHEN